MEAQVLAARTTVEVLEKVGFPEKDDDFGSLFNELDERVDGGDVRDVMFKYKRLGEDGEERTVELAVTFLSIVPNVAHHLPAEAGEARCSRSGACAC